MSEFFDKEIFKIGSFSVTGKIVTIGVVALCVFFYMKKKNATTVQ